MLHDERLVQATYQLSTFASPKWNVVCG